MHPVATIAGALGSAALVALSERGAGEQSELARPVPAARLIAIACLVGGALGLGADLAMKSTLNSPALGVFCGALGASAISDARTRAVPCSTLLVQVGSGVLACPAGPILGALFCLVAAFGFSCLALAGRLALKGSVLGSGDVVILTAMAALFGAGAPAWFRLSLALSILLTIAYVVQRARGRDTMVPLAPFAAAAAIAGFTGMG